MRYFAIGDIHGHFDELKALILKISEDAHFSLATDHLILLGDLVDSGSQSKEVLDFCIEYSQRFPNTFHPLKGNHDDMLIDALRHKSRKYGDYYLWWNQGGRETIKSYTDHVEGEEWEKAIMQPEILIPQEHLDFLETLPLFYETDEYFFVHGGVRPRVALSEQNPEDLLWIRSEFYNSDYDWGKKIIFGHTPFEDYKNMNPETMDFVPYVKEHMIGINTMPRHNMGHLTAVELPSETFFTTV